MSKFVYYDEDGKAVGVGQEIKLVQDKGNGFREIQTIRAGAGALSDDKVEITEQQFDDLNDSKKDLSLEDFSKE